MTSIVKKIAVVATVVSTALVSMSCNDQDPGPLQQAEKSFSITEFDRLEMGDAFVVKVEQGTYFSIAARGDERNIDDLEVRKEGSTLVVRYDEHGNRKHQTYIDITMPTLEQVTFSGAVNAVVTGFDDNTELKISLSGASVAQVDVFAQQVQATLSGASGLTLTGAGDFLSANISGASHLKAFGFPVTDSNINASGASDGKVTVSGQLDVVASGASSVVYRGNPSVQKDVSGGSTVRQE